MSDNVRDVVSSFLRVEIPPRGWNAALAEEDRSGRFGDKQVKGLLVIALKKIEILEEEIKKLKTAPLPQAEMTQTSTQSEKAVSEPVLPPAVPTQAPQQA